MIAILGCSKQQTDKVYYNAFSHNDYTRKAPLLDALSYNYNCVEADIYRIDDELYVSHDYPDSINKVPTLLDLYIKPLADRIDKNKGSVYKGSSQPFYLMIDFKREGEDIYSLLKEQLKPYEKYFCRYENGKITKGPILLFFSGDRPMNSLPKEENRIAFLDGKFNELDQDIPSSLMPVVSDNYKDYFSWDGNGEMPFDQLVILKQLVKKAHSENKKIRLWGGPDTDEYKKIQINCGVDLIGEDNLVQLYNILKGE